MYPRCVYVALYLITCCLPAVTWAQSQAVQREWTDLSGKFKIVATLESADKNVKLTKADGSSIELPLAKLSKLDQDFIKCWHYIETSQQQRDKIQQLVQDFPSDAPRSIDGLAKLSHDDVPTASLAYGTILATAGALNKQEDAEKTLDESIRQLKAIRQHFPEQHSRTLIAALNNRAVLALRGRRTERTVALLAEAAAVEPSVSFVVCHNIRTLLRVASESKSFTLSARNRKRLEEILSQDSPNILGFEPPPRFLYSAQFVVESPGTSTTHSLEDALVQAGLWPELICFVCSGRGFRDCQNCVGGVTSENRVVQIGVDPRTRNPIMGTQTFPTPCKICQQRGGFPCPACNAGRISLGN